MLKGPPPLALEFRVQVQQACARAISRGGAAFLDDNLERFTDIQHHPDTSSSDSDADADNSPSAVVEQVFTVEQTAKAQSERPIDMLFKRLNCDWLDSYIAALRCIC